MHDVCVCVWVSGGLDGLLISTQTHIQVQEKKKKKRMKTEQD